MRTTGILKCELYTAILQIGWRQDYYEWAFRKNVSDLVQTFTCGSESLTGSCPKWLMIWLFISSLSEVNQAMAWSYTESCNFRSSVNSSPSTWTQTYVLGQCGRLMTFFSNSLSHTNNKTFGFELSCAHRMQKYFYTFLSSKYSILAVWYPSLCPWLSTLKRAMPMVSTTERPSGKNLTSLTCSIQPWSANL